MPSQMGKTIGEKSPVAKVATCVHHQTMDKIESVGIKALRDALSGYLRKVSLGVKVLVSDRGKVIAEIVSPGTQSQSSQNYHPKIQDWLDSGVLSLGQKHRTRIGKSGVTVKSISSQVLLDAERGE